MESCWLIEFEGGRKIIISEALYKREVERNWVGQRRNYEAHWFNLNKCRARNEGVPTYGF